MAKITKRKKVKTEKQKLWDVRKEYHETLPESERNPKHKEDFEDVLKLFVKPVTKKKKKG